MTEGLKGRLELLSPSDIYPYPGNAKKHSIEQIETLAGVIERDGFDQPIVVDKDNVIIKGHGRRLAALHLGLKKVPVLVRDDMTPKQARAARLSDNQISLLGEIDMDALNREINEIMAMQEDLDISVEDMGFDAATLELDVSQYIPPASPSFDSNVPTPGDNAPRDLSKPDLSKELTYKELRQIIVDCADEREQERAYTLVTEAGFVARPLTI